MPCTEAHLKHAANWRELNREKVRQIEHIYHINNKEKVSIYKKKLYQFNKECSRLRFILLD